MTRGASQQMHTGLWHQESLTINVLGLVAVDLADGQLTVGGESSTVTARQVVDDNTKDLIARNALKSRLKTVDVLNGVPGYSVSLFFLCLLGMQRWTYSQRKVPISATRRAASAASPLISAAAASTSLR